MSWLVRILVSSIILDDAILISVVAVGLHLYVELSVLPVIL